MRPVWGLVTVGALFAHCGLSAQQTVSRAEAIAAAVARGPRVAFAAADTTAALGQLHAARAFPNPTFSASYTKSTPQYHFDLDLPLEYPWLRSSRIGSARAARVSAGYRFAFERAATALDADTAYTRALAEQALAALSHRSAIAADSLRQIAVARRDAGDASDLDVEQASVFAGTQANAAITDSLDLLSAILSLQLVMGLGADSVRLVLSDSLGPPPADPTNAPAGATLLEAAARADLEAAELGVRTERRNVLGAPSLVAGFETHDPSGDEPGTLPTFGIAIPLPLFNRNRGAIVLAEAERDRARAALVFARTQASTQIARGLRERDLALARVTRDQQLVASALRVVTMSLIAYREGAATLSSVLQAQQDARDILRAYIEDLASAWNAVALIRLLTLTPEEKTR
jgi:cobalt-zinc-cadmium efflux system outer membrane protein